jgi:sorbitol-specific phosphotransferase system component IIBC
MAAISVDQDPITLPNSNSKNSLTININPQLVETVNGVVAQEIRGDQYISSEAQQLLALIHEHAGDNARDLASAVHELEDKSAPKPGRLNAKQKLKKFLIDAGGKVGDVALGVLQSYIEKQLGL